MRKFNLKNAKRIAALLLALVVAVGTMPTIIFAENDSSVKTDLVDKTAIVGEYLEFNVTTMGNDNAGAMVLGHLVFNGGDWSVVESLQYKETQEPYRGQWFDLPANVPFGPAGVGFPLTDNATSTFRVKFKTAGHYPFTITMKSVDEATEYCSTQATVTARDAVASQVKTDLAGKTAIAGEYLEFNVTTMGNDDAGAMVLGHLVFNGGDWSVVESLQYKETQEPYRGQWFDLPANVPFGPAGVGFPLTDNATSTFRVKFKTAGHYPFTITMKSVDEATEYCSTQEMVAARDAVASQVVVDIPNKIVIGQEIDFSVATTANDDADKLVLGHLMFNGGDWSGVEWLKYQETQAPYSGQWFDLPANVPFGPAGGFSMKDAESRFKVKFAAPGEYTFTIALKTADVAQTQLCFVEKTITVVDKVAVATEVNDVAMGTVTASPDIVQVGKSTNIEIKANKGYAISNIMVDGKSYTENFTQYSTSFNFELAPVLDTDVKVNFVRLYKIQVTCDDNGNVTVDNKPLTEGVIDISQPDVQGGAFTVVAMPTKAGFSVKSFEIENYEETLPKLPEKPGEAYEVSLLPDDYTITVVFADIAPAVTEITEAPATEWDNEKSFSFTVTDSAEGDCKVYVSDSAELDAEKAAKLEPATDGTYTYIVKENISESGKSFYIHTLDAADNAAVEEVKLVKMDVATPEIVDIVEVSKNRTIEYRVDVSDAGGSAIAGIWFTTDSEGQSALESAKLQNGKYVFNGSANKQYYIVVKDNAGNTLVQLADELTITIDQITVPETWCADKVPVSITLEKEPAGTTKLYWSVNGEYEDAADAAEAGTEISKDADGYKFDAPENGTYCIYAIDTKTHHMDVSSVMIDKLDNKHPVVNSDINKTPDKQWHNDIVTIQGSVSDEQVTGSTTGSGVEKVVFATENDIDKAQEATLNPDGTYSFTVEIEDDKTLSETYYVWAIDNVGKNSESKAIAVNIDRVDPIGTVSVKDYKSIWKALLEKLTFGIYRNTDVEVTLTYNDVDDTNSGILDVKYYIDDVAAEELDQQGEVAALTEDELKKIEFKNAYTDPVVVAEDRQYAVYFRIEDNAGNVTYLNSDGIIRDTVHPTATITTLKQDAQTGAFAEWPQVSWSGMGNDNATFNDRSFAKWYSNTAIQFKINAEDTEVASGVDTIAYYKSKLMLDVATLKELSAQDWTACADGHIVTIEDNERVVLYVRVADKAGNVTYISSDGIVVDNKEPSGAEIEEKEIIITPEIDNLVEDSGIYKGDVTVSLTVYDPKYDHDEGKSDGDFSGLKKITYEVYTTDTGNIAEGILYKQVLGADEKIGDLLVALASGQTHETVDEATGLISAWTGQIKIPSADFNSNNVVVQITATDNAGNVRISESQQIMIDVTAPTIQVSYDNNTADSTKYFNAKRNAEIVVTERNFNEADFSFVYMKDGNAVEVEGKDLVWEHSSNGGNGDNDTHKAYYLFEDDADYLLGGTPNGKDNAGNVIAPYFVYTDDAGLSYYYNKNIDDSEDEIWTSVTFTGTEPTDFTIDKTPPVVSVSYDNNSAQNDKYFNATRVGTVKIVEHNFSEERVEFKQNASRGGTVPNVSWTHSGDTHTATFNYTEDGDYTFDVTMRDLAGNNSEAANYGSSVAGKDFVIDTTFEDMITQEGVENGVAYGQDDEVIPNIKIYDINLQDYTVTLTGIQKGATIDLTEDVNDLLNRGVDTITGIFDVFAAKQELDGIYTLKITSKDKAGNEDLMEIVFTVNRFGSVYVYDEGDSSYLKELIANGGSYVTVVDQDLIITEYNADKLVADSLKVEITVDGKPLENVLYNVSPEINQHVEPGESGWYQYRYAISKENFKADGVYKISVSSVDGTGNTPENNSYEGMGITFRVDSTQAEITSIAGLEEAIINAQSVNVKFTVFDTIGIKKILVYVDNEILQEITDFSEDMNNYDGEFVLYEQPTAQHVRIVVEDMAGNITDTGAEDFTSAYEFHDNVTVSTNIFVRWYANKFLFWGSIAGVVLVLGLAMFLILRRKKKQD